MKSETSFFNKNLFKTNIRRFAPLWLLFAVAMILLSFMEFNSNGSDRLTEMCYMVGYYSMTMVVVNFLYAFVLCQVLFGDLYSTRIGYALHAFPVRREAIFGTNVLLGLLSALIPYGIVSAVIAGLLPAFRVLALYWLASAVMQFVCFYGIALLAVMCAGNRIGMMLVDGIINFVAVLAYWFADKLYRPLIYGCSYVAGGVTKFSPAWFLVNERCVKFETEAIRRTDYWQEEVRQVLPETQVWVIMAVYTAVGIAAAVLALVLYRRRKLECAGDLLAVDGLKHVFLVLFSLTAGGFFHVAAVEFMGRFAIIFLAAGIVVGYYAGRMLLERKTKVFTLGSLVAVGSMIAVLIISVVIAGMGFFGFADRTVAAEDVKSAKLSMIYSDDVTILDASEDIHQALQIHQAFIDWNHSRKIGNVFAAEMVRTRYNQGMVMDENGIFHESSDFFIRFELKNGKTFTRQYRISEIHPNFEMVRQIMSRPERVLGEAPEALLSKTEIATFVCYEAGYNYKWTQEEGSVPVPVYYDFVDGGMTDSKVTEPDQLRSLMDAVAADCSEGHLAQHWLFNQNGGTDELNFWYRNESGTMVARDIRFRAENCPHLAKWLAENLNHTHNKNALPAN